VSFYTSAAQTSDPPYLVTITVIIETIVDRQTGARPEALPTPPYQEPGSSVAFWAVFGVFWVGEYAMRWRSRFNPSGARTERLSFLVIVGTIGAGVAGALVLASWRTTEIIGGRWPVFVIGLAMMIAGVVIRQWAILVLGRYFTADVRVHADQAVIETGPYRWVRHPSYSGLIIFFVGLGLALTNWTSLALLAVVPTFGLVVRIHSEERVLLGGLGEPYARFAATRRRLFPGVW